MRLNKKRQVLELISTIQEGIDFTRNSDNDNAFRMLQDCNDAIVFITSLMSEEPRVLDLLRSAIDSVQYLIYEEQEDHEYELSLDQLIELMDGVRNIVNHEVKTEIEIAFMPYKVSMWDSMESIFNEAKKDPECTCYVVPIPYYEKNTQGQIIRFCYEGNKFPSYIHTIPFELYEFEKRQPDIIYVHNPYDGYNTLTMVNPRFFSDKLAQHTGMLVYVPYYVAGSGAASEFHGLPSYGNFTKLIVQSQRTKDAFLANGFDDKKILNLGSPKLDAMHAAVREQNNIPRFWKDVVRNKKVFLLNSGIADLLATDTWFAQIEDIIKYFMEREHYVLIWRPHPLTEITIRTMRPYLLATYEMLENEIMNSSNIIVDNNDDIYPAARISDGLISDYSSVMLQYIVTGKPVLGLLSEKMLEKDRSYYSDYLGCYFTQRNVTLSQFVEMVDCNEDIKKEERLSRFMKSVSNADGTSGQKIHYAIKSEITDILIDS